MTLLLVSHSKNLADATQKYIYEMVPNIDKNKVYVAAGTFDLGIGTDPQKIIDTINQIDDNEILIICDLGSAIISSQVAITSIDKNVTISSGTFIEGAFSAAVLISSNADSNLIIQSANEFIPKY